MCGRFAQAYDDSALIGKFLLEEISERIQPQFNLSPGKKVNTIIHSGSKNNLSNMEWGFSEIKGNPLPSLIINSRIETLESGKGYASLVSKHRCLIPVSGFYEWHRGQPFYITLPADKIMVLAGVFTENTGGEKFCSVVTTDSAGTLKNIHHRMPLILYQENIDKWLLSETLPKIDIHAFDIEIIKVGPAVNDVSFDSPECIRPFSENSLF